MSILDLALRRRVTIAMATVAVTLFGLVSLSRLKVNLLPDLSYPTLTIRTELPGAAPLEVENLIARPIEEAAGTIRNVRSVRSVSRSGQADVVLEFAWGTDMDFAGIEVRERLDLLQLPIDARRPLLLRFDPSTEPVMRLALVDLAAAGTAAGDGRLKALRRFADDRLKPALEATEGSAAVKVSGGFEDEIHVYVDQDRLTQLKLDVAGVAERIGAENVNLSGGRLEQGTQRFLVRTLNEFRSLAEMENAVIATVDGLPVYMRDIARVEHGYRDRTAITRLDGRECVELAVYKEGDANTVQLAQAVRERVAELGKSLPADSQLRTVYDQSTFIANSVSEVSDAAIWGGLLSVIVLYLFLRDARATLVAGIVIPVTVIGIFVLMYGFNLTLNIMSLGGIALSVGMLIDNSVVILEAIARKRDAGLSPVEAARAGTAEVAMAVTASTLTTVAVFFPMVFVSGIAGQLFRDQALTVTFAQVLSLLVSLTLVPMMAAWRTDTSERYLPRDGLRAELAGRAALLAGRVRDMGRALRPGEFGRAPAARGLRRVFAWLGWPWRLLLVTAIRLLRASAAAFGALCGLLLAPAVHVTQRGFEWLDRLYPAALDWALRRRAMVLGVALSLLAVTGFVLARLPTELIPQLAQGEFNVKLRLPAGSPLDGTDRVLRAAQAAALELPGLDQAYAVSGTGNRLDANPVDSGENIGELAIRLKQPAGPLEEAAAMERLRRALDALPGVQYEFTRPALFTLSTPLEVVLSGYELERLQAAASAVRDRMEASGAFTDLRSSIEGGHPEIQILFDQDRASKLGLEVRDIADRVVSSLRGDVATRYQLRDRKIDVLVRSVDTRDASIEDVRGLIVNPGAERAVPLAAVADVRLAMGPAEIRRASQERVAVLSAAPAGGNLGEAAVVARDILAAAALPAGVTGVVTGQSEEMQQSFRSLLLAFALAVFLVYLVMASQFESLRHPFVILFTIPMGLIGAVWGLALTGTTVNAVAFIGLILLAGIVVNNAIVLLDAVNQARERGLARHDALVLAGRTRLRPILITSVSTILGLVPMALGLGEGAEVRRPMAITVIGGMLVATVLTLIVIPVLYTLLDRRERPAPAGALAAPPA